MSDFLKIVGLVHLFAYTLLGTAFVCGWLIWRAHSYFGFMKTIMAWHLAKIRWKNRDRDGLTDAEWERGEPRP